MTLLPLSVVAKRLCVSVSLVERLARAAEYAAEIKARKRSPQDVPPYLVGYLNCGFPVPKRIGRSVRRIREEDLEKWLSYSNPL